MQIDEIINYNKHNLNELSWSRACKDKLEAFGVLKLEEFLTMDALNKIASESEGGLTKAYFNPQSHNIYLRPSDPNFSEEHPRNYLVTSSKGCITDDQISAESPLKLLYHSSELQTFLKFVLGEESLHPYSDPLSSVNIHYARQGEELGWHFDNSAFAVTLMIKPANVGGEFEFVRNLRSSDSHDMAYSRVKDVLEEKVKPSKIVIKGGDLLLFRGLNSLHRVTSVKDHSVRHMAVLAYNQKPNVELSENARKTFYGRLN
jgi:hypothetical protein